MPSIIETEFMTKAGSRRLGSVRVARAYARGEVTQGFVAHVPAEADVRAIWGKLITLRFSALLLGGLLRVSEEVVDPPPSRGMTLRVLGIRGERRKAWIPGRAGHDGVG